MDYFAGLDVSVKETSICIVDDTGKIIREEKVASEPQALLAVLKAQINKTDRNGCAWHGTDDAGWALPPGACEDVTQPEASDAADAS